MELQKKSPTDEKNEVHQISDFFGSAELFSAIGQDITSLLQKDSGPKMQ